MSGVPNELKVNILELINKTNDETIRGILLLLLGVLEQSAEGIKSIKDKLDDMQSDEQGLKTAVLSVHAEHHDIDHKWVQKQRAKDDEREKVCAWVVVKMKEEQDSIRDNKKTLRKFIDAAVGQLGVIVISSLATAVSFLAFMK